MNRPEATSILMTILVLSEIHDVHNFRCLFSWDIWSASLKLHRMMMVMMKFIWGRPDLSWGEAMRLMYVRNLAEDVDPRVCSPSQRENALQVCLPNEPYFKSRWPPCIRHGRVRKPMGRVNLSNYRLQKIVDIDLLVGETHHLLIRSGSQWQGWRIERLLVCSTSVLLLGADGEAMSRGLHDVFIAIL